ncbi:hypothetical protein PILCRDRAFT_4719 [Piloderma croceum F 1598]|uniref:Uncharacterized protein n=1 Tax=Piloderma croceum (strain F 1598) TaxID=765440 RepID=A0A0C3G2V3_PILCF|nr:hypothetical protein PILCRDRAFT_4719 [Piloderma croceum F 1598]
MLGFDPYWERIHLAYHYEVKKRTEAHLQANTVFYPGEVAHIKDDGTLTSGLYDFLEWQGMPLRREEMVVKRKLSRESFGRDCVILQRLDSNRYIICYITSFHQAQNSQKIQSSLGKLFAIAIDDTPEYPPGTPSIKITPKWEGHGFLLAIPVPRQNLVRHKATNSRFMLGMGELERVKQLVVEKVKVFKSDHRAIRENELHFKAFLSSLNRRLSIQRVRDEAADTPADEPTTLAASADDFEAPSESTAVISHPSQPERTATLSTSRPVSHHRSMSRPSRTLPRIHYLEANKHWSNLRWLMETTRHVTRSSSYDMNSSYYRPDIDVGHRVYKGAASILKPKAVALQSFIGVIRVLPYAECHGTITRHGRSPVLSRTGVYTARWSWITRGMLEAQRE